MDYIWNYDFGIYSVYFDIWESNTSIFKKIWKLFCICESLWFKEILNWFLVIIWGLCEISVNWKKKMILIDFV